MSTSKRMRSLTACVVILVAILSACAPATPQVIEVPKEVVVEKEKVVTVQVEKAVEVEKKVVETVVVEKEVPVEKKVVETVIVEKEVPVEKEASEITIVLEERFENLDAHNHNGLSAYLLFKNIYGTLVDRDPEGNLIPNLATEWKALEPTLWEFKLRQGVKFSNGEPWDAKSAKASVDRLVSTGTWGTQRQFGLWRNLEGAEIVDDYTIHIRTEVPMGAILNNLTMGFMMPASIIAKHPTDPITNPSEVIGTGPYQLVKWVAGQSATLEINPEYWGEPKPQIDRVVFHTILEPATRIAALQAGDAHIAWSLQPPEAVDQLRSDPNIQIHDIESLRVMWMAFGLPREPFSDIKMREAAQRAVDFDLICDTVLQGVGKCGNFLVTPGCFGVKTDLDPEVIAYDPDRSKELLAEAGYAAGDGPEVRFISIVGGPTQVFEAIIDQLKAVGFKPRLDLMEVGDYITVRNEGNFDIFANGFTCMTGDCDFILPVMYYTGISKHHYSNPKVDELLDQAAAETDQAKRLELYGQAQEIIWNDRADFWHYQAIIPVGSRKTVGGFVARPDNLLPLEYLYLIK